MRFAATPIALASLGLAAGAAAQITDPPPAPSVPTGDVAPVTFDESFRDPGGRMAESLAALEGISREEAERRLRLTVEASVAARALAQRHPTTFVGVQVVNGPEFAVHALFSGTVAQAQSAMGSVPMSDALRQSMRPRGVSHSRSQVRQRADALLNRMRALGLNAEVAVSSVEGKVKVLARDPAAIRGAVASGALQLPEDTEVEAFSGIRPTAIAGGAAYNFLDQVRGCTTGFVVQRKSDYFRGISTAGHCGEPGKHSTSYS